MSHGGNFLPYWLSLLYATSDEIDFGRPRFIRTFCLTPPPAALNFYTHVTSRKLAFHSLKRQETDRQIRDQDAFCLYAPVSIYVCSCRNPVVVSPNSMGASDLSAASPRAFADRGINANNDSNDDVRSIWSEKSTHIDGQNDLRFWKSNSQHSIPSADDQRHRGPDAPDDSPDRPTTQFSFYSPGLEYAIHASDLNSFATTHQPVSDLLENGEAGDVWWIDATAPSMEDIEWLSKVFGIHPLTTEDIGVQETREKIELFGHYYFVSLRSSHPNRRAGGTSWSILNQYALVFRGGIISVTFGPSPHAANVRSRIMEHKSHLALTSDWICYALM